MGLFLEVAGRTVLKLSGWVWLGPTEIFNMFVRGSIPPGALSWLYLSYYIGLPMETLFISLSLRSILCYSVKVWSQKWQNINQNEFVKIGPRFSNRKSPWSSRFSTNFHNKNCKEYFERWWDPKKGKNAWKLLWFCVTLSDFKNNI
jgi:hypothetical protein